MIAGAKVASARIVHHVSKRAHEIILPSGRVSAPTMTSGRTSSGRITRGVTDFTNAQVATAVEIDCRSATTRIHVASSADRGTAPPAMDPARPVPEARTVFAWGVIAIAAYVVPLILNERGILPGWDRYRPIVGALIEVAALHTFWTALLTAWRTGRPFRREPRIWLGFGLALVPPALELIRFIVEWKP